MRHVELSLLLVTAWAMGVPAGARAGGEVACPDVAGAEPAPNESLLPPQLPWEGNRRSPAVSPDDLWATPFERSGFVESPSYDETVSWLRALAGAAPELEVVTLGKSARGRDIVAVVASRDRAFTPGAMVRSGKPLLFAHAGIHAGEIAGKDAGMMLLRDLAFGKKRRLLRHASFLFVPILNVDGHERRSRCNRINQRGPAVMGWRTNGRNLNLNRDFSKLETPEVRAVVRALRAWRPDLYLDIHVTDGIDYQYDITFGFTGPHASSPAISGWLTENLVPAFTADLEAENHIPGPLVFAANGRDHAGGTLEWTAPPRFSHGYGDAAHVPTVLVETHSLKPFPQRVFGTYVLLESALRLLGRSSEGLRAAVALDRARRPGEVVLAWEPSKEPPEQVSFKAVAFENVPSETSGGTWTRWLGEPIMATVPRIRFDRPSIKVTTPLGYWIPPDWPEVIDALAAHGVRMERLDAPRDVRVQMYRLTDPRFASSPTEGHLRVNATATIERRLERMPAGSVWVPTDQPLCELIVMLLEPAAPDSFFQWGYFLEIFERTEYFEAYVLEPLAAGMIAEDPTLADAFRRAVAEDEELAKDPRARLDWFYRRSPYVDERWMLYPVARVPRRGVPESSNAGPSAR